MSIRERLTFLRQLQADFRHTGAIQPSSKHLAWAMTRPLRESGLSTPAALRIAEIGPGTGPVTRSIAGAMRDGDRLECYEINPTFARFLEELIESDTAFADVRAGITVHNAAAQEISPSGPFDVVVCSAPLNNFEAETIAAILEASFAALRPNGTFTFFEYLALPAIKRMMSGRSARAKLDAARTVKQEWLDKYSRGSTAVWLNLPPARVHYLVAHGP